MIGWEEGESARFCFIIALAKVHFLGSATRSPMALYLSSSLKGSMCSPRPYAPPVARLSKGQTISLSVPRLISRLAIGSYHLEYRFPSTHSTNCVSMALFLDAHLHDVHRAGSLSTATLAIWVVVLVLYLSSIVGGRLCTGMDYWTFLSGSSSELLGGCCNGSCCQRSGGGSPIAVGVVRRLCPAKRLTQMLTFLRNSFDWDASLPPCQPTSIAS